MTLLLAPPLRAVLRQHSCVARYLSSASSDQQTLSLGTGRIEVMAMDLCGLVNDMVSSYSFGMSLTCIGSMLGTISSKSWKVWLMSHPM